MDTVINKIGHPLYVTVGEEVTMTMTMAIIANAGRQFCINKSIILHETKEYKPGKSTNISFSK